MTGMHAKKYASALFEIAVEENSLDEIFCEVKQLRTIFSDNSDYLRVLSAPTLSFSEKEKSIDEVFKGKLSETMYNTIMVLIENSRITSFNYIADEFIRLYNEKNGIVEITVITAKPLKPELKQKLKHKLVSISSKEIILNEKIDKNILGGIMLSYNNTQIDASIKSKLDAMRSKINSIIA